ncbi:NAD-dependent epimerase/dehydratase family protein [Demequina pelophila]|uniref:NAD-dependent epimerase/dehydratase family protein n=1 Tax=Demequina pelophila TaxID=1638984 RepID=UPI0009E42DE3|nr:NAD(P)-dependent oxidoreductase [Demequina pelophila]
MRNDWRGRECLVTGGAGFGGSHLVADLVERGASVTVLDRAPIEGSPLGDLALADRVAVVPGDVRDAALVAALVGDGAFDDVFHLAADPIVAHSIADPATVVDTNVRGTAAILEACRTAPAPPRLVFASSGAYYGDNFSAEPIPETQEAGPATNLYGPSKAAAEMLVRGYGTTFGLPYAICRFMNTYGPGDRHLSRLVPRALAQLEAGGTYDFGGRDDGSTRLDFLYVKDMARAYTSAADHLATGGTERVFNFGTGTLTSVRAVAGLLSRAFDGQVREPVFSGPPRDTPRQKRLDVSRSRAVLGWTAGTPLEQGLAETVAWHRSAVPAAA